MKIALKKSRVLNKVTEELLLDFRNGRDLNFNKKQPRLRFWKIGFQADGTASEKG